MPKKTNYLSHYFVTAPGVDVDLAFIKADEVVKASEKNYLEHMMGNSPEFSGEPYWINCAEYFKNINPLQKPFKIVRLGGDAFNGYHIEHICDEKDMEVIQKALNEEEIYEWPKQLQKSLTSYFRAYLFGSYLWELSRNEHILDKESLRLLFLESLDKERKKFERLKNKFSGVAGEKLEATRESISEEVRIFVWRRDEGKCVKCGSQQNLEFDHVIPFAKGGGNTARNIQILCEKCNREKSANIE